MRLKISKMREKTIKSKVLGEVISKRKKKKIQLQKVCIIKNTL